MIAGTAQYVAEVADAYKTAHRQRDKTIVPAVAVLGQKGTAAAAGLSRRRVRQLLEAADTPRQMLMRHDTMKETT
ncbi:hypothetical protein [Clavibacter michiganensis]|nr:hypothetical protein [Clavibacter michiganensis]QIT13020.1 hypothetical protein GRD74_15660 [Clavibacter michiganensis subsp. michiganensis]QIT16164.1 hypothetical protein GRD61_15750 [Clavibacter michiganensis subsp. michiganensis]